MKTLIHTFTVALLALAVLAGAPAYGKNILRLKVPARFDYSTQRTVPVNIAVALPAGKVAAVSFYALDRVRKNGTQLVTGLTQPGGVYQGELVVPAAVRDVLVTVRYGGWVKEVRVKARRAINRTIAMPG